MVSVPRTRRFVHRPQGPAAVWVLNGAIAAAAVAVYLLGVQDVGPVASPHLPWWGLAIGYAVAERIVVNVHFRRSAHSFSFGDVPLVFGLLFAAGPALVLAAVAGAAVPLVLDRRLPAIKTVFNLAQFALTACVAIVAMRFLAGGAHGLGPSVWLPVLAAVELAALVGVGLIGTAIALAEGHRPKGMLRDLALRDLVVTMANTSMALAAAVLIADNVSDLPLIVVPGATLYLAYRAYSVEHRRHERLEFLYEATRTLAKSPEIILALEGLLTRSLEAFRAEIAEVVLFSTEGQPPLRTSLSTTGRKEAMVPIDPGVAADLAELVTTEGPVLGMEAPFASARVRAHMEQQGVTHAMLAMLRADDRVIGTLMLANRPGVIAEFDAEDLKLFEALAGNTSMALQFDRLEQSIWQLRELQEQLQHQAFHDPLTDLANRSLFNNQVRDALARDDGPVAVLFVDVDDFKTVNDTLGHAVGDELLTMIAERLRASVLPTDVVARLGGDEFAVLVQHVGDPEDAGRAVAARIVDAFDRPASAGSRQIRVRLTIGIATGRPGYDHADEIIRNADLAMYHAKRAGKNSWQLFEPAMRRAVLERHGLHAELEAAIEAGDFRVEYQPIFTLRGTRARGAEALLRWNRPGKGPVLPTTFIPLAEETGLIKQLGQFTLTQACRDARSWIDHGSVPSPFVMQVNLSAVELEDPDLSRRVDAVLRETGLPPEALILELTESAVLRDAVQGARALNELKELGVGLALDDFGTGYSSLSYLRTLPFDMLKIARPFVAGAPGHAREESFLRMMLELGRTLNLHVVAEGIETPAELNLLRELDCELAQGFLLGMPAPAAEFLAAFYAPGTSVAA